jgi:hypothetical protein
VAPCIFIGALSGQAGYFLAQSYIGELTNP